MSKTTVGDVEARAVLTEKKNDHYLTRCHCDNRGNVDSILVARSNRRATYGDYWILILQFFVNCFSVA